MLALNSYKLFSTSKNTVSKSQKHIRKILLYISYLNTLYGFNGNRVKI